MLLITALSFSVLFLIRDVYGQTTHRVTVGLEGSFFNPPTIAAGRGDTITFVFSGEIHTVTQSSFEAPCSPLPGGFNSGLAGMAGKPRNSSTTAPTWDLHITDVSTPIWFFCQANRPAFHCSAGMVGAINPPSQGQYTRFLNSAKAVSESPSAPITLVLTGVGAFATAPPAVAHASSTITIPLIPTYHSFTLPSIGNRVASPTNTTSIPLSSPTEARSGPFPSSSSHEDISVTVGGAVGGSLGSLLVFGTMFLCWRQQRLAQKRCSDTFSAASFGKEREFETMPYTYSHRRSPSFDRERLSRASTHGSAPGHQLQLPVRLEPLRRRATTIGSTSSHISNIGSLMPFTGTVLDRESRDPLSTPRTQGTFYSDQVSRLSPLPPLPTSKATVSHDMTRHIERESDLSTYTFPANITPGPAMGRFSHQRYLFVNNPSPSSRPSMITPEQYWSTQVGQTNDKDARYPFGYSSSPPNYLTATAGRGANGGWPTLDNA